ncbi:hypothetical protein NIES4071_29410 [Calothrix sp. NIES-4071]|nr:hypothetical protein NIES4071_29410 [Calothrix sp. NIES-4071]BAZ57261.1 hypothetical protein NIES4105_29350 [Calothrix sp. NIES-4105]
MSDEELKQLIQSNALAVQRMLDAIPEERLKRDESNRRFDELIQRMDEVILRMDKVLSRITVLNESLGALK